MRSSAVVAPLALAAGASAWNNVTYTTQVVTAYTTYCPGPTVITQNQKTYTVKSATTLTITDCPCTVTKPVVPTLAPATSAVPAVYTTPAAVPVVSVPAVPVQSVPVGSPAQPPVKSVVYVPGVAAGTAAPSGAPVTTTSPSAPIFTGAGSKAVASGMSLAGLAAVAAFFL